MCDACHKAVADGRAVMGSPEHRAKLRAAIGDQRGENNRNWRHERRPNAQGYFTVLVDHDDSIGVAMLGEAYLGRGRRHILEHRLVMAHHLGRPLASSELVHHVNGKRHDNRIENLRLMASRSDHAKAVHFAECPHCGTPLRGESLAA